MQVPLGYCLSERTPPIWVTTLSKSAGAGSVIVSMLTSTMIGSSPPSMAAICPDQAPAVITTTPQWIFPAAVARR